MTTLAAATVQWTEYRYQLCLAGAIAASTHGNQSAIAAGISRDDIGRVPVAELRKSHLDLWVARRRQSCADITVAGELQVVRQILNWAVDEGMIASRPRLPTVSVAAIERALPSDDDYLWFMRTMAAAYSDALMFMCMTGLAPHELERLQVRDFDLATREIAIGEREGFAIKAAARRRRILLNPTAAQLWGIAAIGKRPDATVWPKGATLQKAMRRHFLMSADAPPGAGGLTPKMMRKWFASKIAVEHSEAVLQRLLGHRPGSRVTRRHYVRSQDAELAAAVQGLAL